MGGSSEVIDLKAGEKLVSFYVIYKILENIQATGYYFYTKRYQQTFLQNTLLYVIHVSSLVLGVTHSD